MRSSQLRVLSIIKARKVVLLTQNCAKFKLVEEIDWRNKTY